MLQLTGYDTLTGGTNAQRILVVKPFGKSHLENQGDSRMRMEGGWD
jgi:hypothetical protein